MPSGSDLQPVAIRRRCLGGVTGFDVRIRAANGQVTSSVVCW